MTHPFDFQAYIAAHRNPGDNALILPQSPYAFRGDLTLLSKLHAFQAMRIYLKSGKVLWKRWGQKKLLQKSRAITAESHAQIWSWYQSLSTQLKAPRVPIYWAPSLKQSIAHSFGFEKKLFLACQPALQSHLSEPEWKFFLAKALGQIQNGHVPFLTLSYYQSELANSMVKWAVMPATTMLRFWKVRGLLTTDRAGLLGCKDIEVAQKCIQTDPEPHHELRIKALKYFAQSDFYKNWIKDRNAIFRPLSEIDEEISNMLKISLWSSSSSHFS